MLTLEEIAAFVQADARTAAHVQFLHRRSLHLAESEAAPEIANRLVQDFGFHAIHPGSWSQLDSTGATDVAIRVFNEELAYKSKLLPDKTASHYATQVVSALSPYKAKFLCNAKFGESFLQWDPIGDATFEIALVGFDQGLGFLLYAHADD